MRKGENCKNSVPGVEKARWEKEGKKKKWGSGTKKFWK